MPSQIAHALVGQAALEAADASAARDILGGPLAPFFRLGCQGPDLFYHSQRTRPLALHYGVLAHRRGFGRLLESLADLWAREDGDPRSPWAAFVLGFATHGPLDRAAHPFVVHFAGWPEPGKPETARYRSCHAFLERILDVLLWERRTGSPVREFDARERLFPPGELPVLFSAGLAAALRRAYPRDGESDPLLPARTANALADSRRFLLLTNPAVTSRNAPGTGERPEAWPSLDGQNGRRIVSVLYPEIFDRRVDWTGERGRSWIHPCQGGPERRESFFELCGAAEREAAGLLSRLLEGFGSRSVPKDLAELAGYGTLNVGDAEGRPARPLYGSPLPLPEAMSAELEMRRELSKG